MPLSSVNRHSRLDVSPRGIRDALIAAASEQFPDLGLEQVLFCQTGLHPGFAVVDLFSLFMREFGLVVPPTTYELLQLILSKLWFSPSILTVPRTQSLTYRPGWYARLQFGEKRLWVSPRQEAALSNIAEPTRGR